MCLLWGYYTLPWRGIIILESTGVPLRYPRPYHRFHLFYPVIFGGTPFIAEDILPNLSLMGCSVMREK